MAIIGSIDGPTTHLAEQLVAKARLPLISPVSTDKSVNLAGVPWMFSCAPDDHVLAPLVAGAIAAELRSHGGPFVILSATDHDSRLASHEILKALSERRVVVDQRFEFQPGAVSFESQRAAMQARPPAVALVIAGPEDSARVVIALRQRRPEATVFGTHQMGRHLFLRRAGAAAEGARFPLLFVLDSSDPVSRRFVERFGKQFGHEPDYAAALSHDAARLLVAAVARAGLDRARLREAIVALPPWRGTAGEIRWDSTGQNTRGVPQMGVVRDGRLVPLQSPASRSAQESRGATRSSGLP